VRTTNRDAVSDLVFFTLLDMAVCTCNRLYERSVGLQKCRHLEGEDLSELAAVTSGFGDDLEYMALWH
jgi:hypothetical protein